MKVIFFKKKSIMHGVLAQQLEFTLETLMTKLKLSYFTHIMQRPGSLEKSIILRKGRRKKMERMTSSKVDGFNYSGCCIVVSSKDLG